MKGNITGRKHRVWSDWSCGWCTARGCEEVGVVQGTREVAKQDMQNMKGLKRIDGVSCTGWLGLGD